MIRRARRLIGGWHPLARGMTTGMLLLVCTTPARAQPAPTAAPTQESPHPPPQRPSFQDLRYEEDWGVLRDRSLRGQPLDVIKYIELGPHAYLSLGGEVRQRVDYWHQANFGHAPAVDLHSFLQRYQLHADWHIARRLRAFGQFASGLEAGKHGGPWPTDENPAEVRQAFVEWRDLADDGSHRWAVRLGRQEMAFGQSHFISTADFFNSRRAFDGVRVQATRGVLEFNAFLTRPVEVDPGAFDDGSDSNQLFGAASIFAPSPFSAQGRTAIFYINLRTDRWAWERGAGRDERHMLGLRLTAQERHWDYTYEVLLQWGRFAEDTPIRAWATTTDTGYTIAGAPMFPRVGVRLNVTSGDAGHGSLGTFHPMFPDNAYSGKSGLVGPSNSMDITPNLRLAVTSRVYFVPDVAFFWRQKTSDGLYGLVSPYLVVSGRSSPSRYVGAQVSLPVQIALTSRLAYTAAFCHLFAGAFVQDIDGRPTTFLTNFMTYKF